MQKRPSITTEKQSTIEDLQSALKDPNSLAYKDTMNMLVQSIQIELIIEKLIDHYIDKRIAIKAAEKEAIMQQLLAHERESAEMMLAQYQAQLTTYVDQLTADARKHRLEQIPSEISKLDTRIASLQQQLSLVSTAKQKNTSEWKATTNAQMHAYTEVLKDKGLKFVGPRGDILPVSKEAEKLLLNAFTGPAPCLVVKMLADSLAFATHSQPLIATDEKTMRPVPPPPPLFPKMPTPAVMVAKNNVNVEIRLLGALAEGSGEKLLAALRRNKEAMEALPAIVKDKGTSIFAEALNLIEGEHKIEGDLEQAVQQKHMLEQELAMLKQAFSPKPAGFNTGIPRLTPK